MFHGVGQDFNELFVLVQIFLESAKSLFITTLLHIRSLLLYEEFQVCLCRIVIEGN